MRRLTGRGPRLSLLLASLSLPACSAAEREADAPSSTGGDSIALAPAASLAPDSVAAASPRPPRPPLSPARDADQDFLRHMLDHHETVIALAHGGMMEPAGHQVHGQKADPAAFDSRLDGERQEMLALLARFYGETYSPRAQLDSGMAAAGAEHPPASAAPGAMDMSTDAGAPYRAGAALVDRYLSRLTRSEVRALARRLRESQLELARQMAAPSGL